MATARINAFYIVRINVKLLSAIDAEDLFYVQTHKHDKKTDLHVQRLKTAVRPVLSIKQQTSLLSNESCTVILQTYTDRLVKSAVCQCGRQQTMNHTVDTCPLTKSETGLQSLQEFKTVFRNSSSFVVSENHFSRVFENRAIITNVI